MEMLDPLDQLDASLQDFEPTTPPHRRFDYPSHHSGFRSDDGATESEVTGLRDSVASAGGYSPPAWRRLGNGDRSSGFWRRTDNILGDFPQPRSRESSPEYDSQDSEGEDDAAVLERAIRTRLPTGSFSPEKGRSPPPHSAGGLTATAIRLDEAMMRSPSASVARETPDNCECVSDESFTTIAISLLENKQWLNVLTLGSFS